MPLIAQYLPSLLDRADGQSGRPGTPEVPGSRIFTGNSTNPLLPGLMLEESSTSPELERAEQGTIRHVYRMDTAGAKLFIKGYGRGKILVDSEGNLTRVLSAAYAQQRGNYAQFSVTEESLSFDNPPDEFEVEDVEMNPAIEKHPRFRKLREFNLVILDPTTNIYSPIDPTGLTGFDLIQRCYQAAQHPGIEVQDDAELTIDDIAVDPANPTNSELEILDLANELVYKLRAGEETFYLSGYRVSWSSYFWKPVTVNPGGYIESPYPDSTQAPGAQNGGLPAYFWSDVGDGSWDGIIPDPVLNNIFIKTAALVNPNVYKNGLSWLRVADRLSYQRTWFRLTRAWIGAPLGHWDIQLYTGQQVNP